MKPGRDRTKRAKKVWRRKVARLAAYSRAHTVKNCTIPTVNEGDLIDIPCPWDKEKTLKGTKSTAVYNAAEWYKKQRKAVKDEIRKFHKDDPKRDKYKHKPWFMLLKHHRKMLYEKTTFHPNKGSAWYMEQVVQHKIAKWERKNPCPVKEDQNPPDIFEQQYVVPWKEEREKALERIRDFVVSMYDKLPLTGRFQESDNKFTEEKVAELKDYGGDGHKINKVDTKKSRLIKNAQKVTDKVHSKRSNLVCTNLRDHKRDKGRIILPKAA